MRTTLTIDDDLLRELKERALANDQPLKQAVNDTIRAGLRAGQQTEPYRLQPARSLGLHTVSDTVKLLQLAGELDDADALRKLAEGR